MRFLPYGKQFIDKQDKLSVIKALSNKVITTGEQVTKFEKKLQKYFNCKYVSVCNSGTSAIYLALASIDLKKNDVIIMPAINFIASYNVAKLFEANVFLADVDAETGQMSPQNILDCCKKFKLKKIKAIITMYHGGYPLNADKFFDLKKKFNCLIIEDACHALGAEYIHKKKKIRIGSCLHADISTFSMHPLKTITTGEGGVVTTNIKKIAYKIKLLRSHGIKRKLKKHWKYDVILNGLNLRLTDFQCALGLSQLSKISKILEKRKKISEYYDNKLKKIKEIKILEPHKKYNSSFHLYLINLKKTNIRYKENLIKFMLSKKIVFQYHYIPIYKFKVFRDKYISKNSEKFYKNSLSMPIFYELRTQDSKYIVNCLIKYFKANG